MKIYYSKKYLIIFTILTYTFIIAPDLFSFSSKSLNSSLGYAKLVESDLELTLDFIVVSLDFGKLKRLFLNGLLQVNVHLVGAVQGHFQFGDLDLQLLLDAGNLGLETSLGFDDACIELFDFNAGGFAGIEITTIKILNKPLSLFNVPI